MSSSAKGFAMRSSPLFLTFTNFGCKEKKIEDVKKLRKTVYTPLVMSHNFLLMFRV